MKKILLSLLIVAFFMGTNAQEKDSLALEQVKILKKEISTLKKKNSSLQARIAKLQKAHESDLKETAEKFETAEENLKSNEVRIDEQADALKASEESTQESLTLLGQWSKKMLLILAIAAVVLFLVLLILVISNRQRIEKKYLALEAKVDNTREDIEKEIKAVLKRHEEDILSLKASAQKGNK